MIGHVDGDVLRGIEGSVTAVAAAVHLRGSGKAAQQQKQQAQELERPEKAEDVFHNQERDEVNEC
jgi:hypothetical protein